MINSKKSPQKTHENSTALRNSSITSLNVDGMNDSISEEDKQEFMMSDRGAAGDMDSQYHTNHMMGSREGNSLAHRCRDVALLDV